MSVIQASSAGVRDMSDGSLRITFEFDPRYAKEAYSLFGARGTACAIAALTQAASTQAAQQEAIAEPKTKAGELCIMACNFCKDPNFWKWLTCETSADPVTNEIEAKEVVCLMCCIDSRKEIDTDSRAAEVFHRQIRVPFLAWKSKPIQRAA